jgi:hypothetical protein
MVWLTLYPLIYSIGRRLHELIDLNFLARSLYTAIASVT